MRLDNEEPMNIKADAIDRELHDWCEQIGGDYSERREGTVIHTCRVKDGKFTLNNPEHSDEAYLEISDRDSEHAFFDVADLDEVNFDHGRIHISEGFNRSTFKF